MTKSLPLPHYGDYLIFVDESGDHGLLTIDEKSPFFALVFVLIKKSDYIEKIAAQFQKLKFQYFGHEQVILHERDIRKESGIFAALRANRELRERFLEDLTNLIEASSFHFFSSVIDKNNLLKRYKNPHNPYEISMLFCMEKSLEFLLKNNQKGKKISVIIESRDKELNKGLELEFRRICDNQATLKSSSDFKKIDFELVFADKKSNSTGLQIADLIARPIALSKLRNGQSNRAYQAIMHKGAIKLFP
jgi:hypothetical protein